MNLTRSHTHLLTCLSCLQVQLTLLTAIVKLFLKKPSETQELVQQVLSLATQVIPTVLEGSLSS